MGTTLKIAIPGAPDPEFVSRPQRRTFPVTEKLRILALLDAAHGKGEIGAILRREGIYSSMVSAWRHQRDAAVGAQASLIPVKRGPKAAEPNPLTRELTLARRENVKLARQLVQAEAIIAIQKKVSVLLGIVLAPTDPLICDDDES